MKDRTKNSVKILSCLLMFTSMLGYQQNATSTPSEDAPDPNQIVLEAENKYAGHTMISDITMVLVNSKGQERIREMRSFRKNYGESLKDEKSAYYFLYPKDVKGTAYLSHDWEEEARPDDSWLYLPSLKSFRRLAASDNSDAFLGSDFTYTDIKTRKRQFWDYSMVSVSEQVDGHDCWVVEGVPKSGQRKEVLDETGYEKVRIWIRKDNSLKVKGEFWVGKGRRKKFLKASDIVQIDGIWVAKTTVMVTTRNNTVEHQTVLKMDNIIYNTEIDDTFFTAQRLHRGI